MWPKCTYQWPREWVIKFIGFSRTADSKEWPYKRVIQKAFNMCKSQSISSIRSNQPSHTKSSGQVPTTLPTTQYGLYILYILTWPQWTPITAIQWPQHMATTESSQNIPIYQPLKCGERSSSVSETSLTSITDSSQTLQYNNPWSAVQDLGERSSEVSKISMTNIKDDVRSGQMLMTVLNVIYLMSTKYYSKSLRAQQLLMKMCCKHCTCWWPSTVRCQVISRYSDDQDQVIHLHAV